MQTITKQYRTETAHRLVNYDGKCAHLHGHSYLWEFTVSTPQFTRNGMVMDFKNLKKTIALTVGELDHALILCVDDIDASALQEMLATNGEEQRVFIWGYNPTAENMAAWAAEKFRRVHTDLFYTKCYLEKIRLWETANSFVEWVPNDAR